MKRLVPPFLVVLGLGLFAGFAYFTQHPDSPYLEKAQQWPVVGELARGFREAYLGPAADPDSAEEGAGREPGSSRTEVVVIRIGPDGKPLTEAQRAGDEPIYLPSGALPKTGMSETRSQDGTEDAAGNPRTRTTAPLRIVDELTATERAAERSVPRETLGTVGGGETPEPFRPGVAIAAQEAASYLVEEWAWFLPGQSIHTAADADSATRERLVSMAWLPVLGHQGSWAEVMYDDQRGWIDTSWEPPYRRKGARRGLLRHRHEPVQSSDWGDLVRARKILDLKKPVGKLGEYELLTDVEDPALLEFLDAAAVAAEEAYFARFGRLPSGNPGRTVVLFETLEHYREYSGSAQMVSDRHVGHARTGILALFAEGRTRENLGRTLVHEIGHLLNDRALAWNLPPWLEEGMATDLGSVWVEDPASVTQVAGASSASLSGRGSFVLQGPEARLLGLERLVKAGQLPPVSILLRLDYETFHTKSKIETYAYAHSVALVRYLLDGDGGRHAGGFREFLKRIAGGRGADPNLLLELLDVEMEELDGGFRTWLGGQIQDARERMEERYRRRAAR